MSRAFAAALLAALVLAGCGQKGPLYLPDKKPAAVTPPPASPAAVPATTPAPAQPTQKKSDDPDSDSQPPK